MATLSGPYKIDRPNPPRTFYTPKKGYSPLGCIPGATVLAATNSHPHAAEGWVTVGYASRQTPFGQGIYMSIQIKRLRPATPDEIKHALSQDHPHGTQFRPRCQELDNADLSLQVSGPNVPKGGAVRRVSQGQRPIDPATRARISHFAAKTQTQYAQILSDWDNITRCQIEAILSKLR